MARPPPGGRRAGCRASPGAFGAQLEASCASGPWNVLEQPLSAQTPKAALPSLNISRASHGALPSSPGPLVGAQGAPGPGASPACPGGARGLLVCLLNIPGGWGDVFPLASGSPELAERGPSAVPFRCINECGSVFPQMTPKRRRRSPLKHSKMETKRKTKRGRRKTRVGSSNSCSTLQMVASQVLEEGDGQRPAVVGVTGFLLVWVLGIWAGGYFILKCKWLTRVHCVPFPSNTGTLTLQGWEDGR